MVPAYCHRRLRAAATRAAKIDPRIAIPLGAVGLALLWCISNRPMAARAWGSEPPPVDPLAAYVYAEYPELDPNGPQFGDLDDWNQVIRLREFSYRHTAYANNVKWDAYRAGAEMVDQVITGQAPLVQAYRFFDAGRGGVVCGHTAELLQRLFTWAGYEAWYLNIGFDPPTAQGSSFTHALTLVRIEVDGPDGQRRSIVTIHDPSTNVSCVDAEGRPLDYFDMLAKLAQGESEQIQFAGDVPVAFRRSHPITVAFGGEIEQRRPEDFAVSWNIGASSTWSATPDGRWIFRGPRTVANFERLGDDIWKPELLRERLPPETIQLHRFPFVIRGTEEGPALLQQAREVLASTRDTATSTASGNE